MNKIISLSDQYGYDEKRLSRKHLNFLYHMGFNGVYLPLSSSIKFTKELYDECKAIGYKFFVHSINPYSKVYTPLIENFFPDYFYLDEPYANWVNSGRFTTVEIEKILKDIRDKIFIHSPMHTQFTIGDIRKIITENYTSIPNINYTYSSYVDTFFFNGKPQKFGLPDQSPAIKKLIKKANVPWIWMYNGNKLFATPDEYKSLFKLARENNIHNTILYCSRTTKNGLPLKEQLKNCEYFLEEKRPYNVFQFFTRNWKALKKEF